jgi:DNA gyrase subunit A
MVGAHAVMENDALMLITAKGKMIRMKVSDIRVISRVTQGVRLIALDEGDTLVSATTVEPEDEGPSDLVEPEKPTDKSSNQSSAISDHSAKNSKQ